MNASPYLRARTLLRAAGLSMPCQWIRRTCDDYPKMALWNNPQPGGAYHITFNLFASPTTFTGVKAFALDRAVDANRRARQRD